MIATRGGGALELCEELLRRHAALAPAILLAVSAADSDFMERAFEAGASDVIRRPIPWRVFLHRARRLLEIPVAPWAGEASRAELEALRRLAGANT